MWISSPKPFYRRAHFRVDVLDCIRRENCSINYYWKCADHFVDKCDSDFLIGWSFVFAMVSVVCSLCQFSGIPVFRLLLLCSEWAFPGRLSTNTPPHPYIEQPHTFRRNGILVQISYARPIDALLHTYEFPDTLCTNNILHIIGKRFKFILILFFFWNESDLQKKRMIQVIR